MDKQEIYQKLNNISYYLKENLSSQKDDFIKRVQKATPKGCEPEGHFIKIVLSPLLEEFFKENLEGLIIEGVRSRGSTQFKNYFFGSRPAPDFRFNQLDTVGEVKYARLRLRSFATALGQLITYIESSKNEIVPSKYGYLIFFNTEKSKELQEQEKKFINLIWKRDNIFITII